MPSNLIAGIAFRSPDKFLAWAPVEGRVYIRSGISASGWDTLWVAYPIGAAFLTDTTIAAVSGFEKTLTVFQMDGSQLSKQTWSIPLSLHSTVWSGKNWYAGGPNASGQFVIYRLRGSEVQRVRAIEGTRSAFLTRTPSGILVATTDRPIRTIQFDSTGEVIREFAPPSEVMVQLSKPVGLRTIWLGDGFVQTVSDLSRDHRMIQVYDTAGRPSSAIRVVGPLAFVEADVTEQLLLAVRATTTAELVIYRWRWSVERAPTPVF